jgi:hypothetical protein
MFGIIFGNSGSSRVLGLVGRREIAVILVRAASVLLAAATLAAVSPGSASAETYRPWCVQYGGASGDNGLTCTFTSYEQCMMTGGPGTGGQCVQNPWYLWYGEHGQGRGGDNRRQPKRQ